MTIPPPGDSPQRLVEKLSKSFSAGSFYPFIQYIRFPNYKSLKKTAKLTFDFPITVILGKNGSNKSSIVQAIYGVPNGYSTGHYWFSTELDPISKSKENPRYIYAYYIPKINTTVEVIKTRAGYSKGADYWEPARPRIADGMLPMPPENVSNRPFRSATRWNAMQKNSLLLDFRSEISAYDRTFNYLDRRPTKLISTAQDFIRERSKHLKKIIEDDLKTYTLYKKERVFYNKLMDRTEILWASYIIGKDYEKVRIVEHSLFDSKAVSVHLTVKNNLESYSEALAGSGETTICSLVHKIYHAKNKSLILLDEPEVSLHPGAQKRLIEFLLTLAIEKQHQIIISSHSPFIIEHLPNDALKLAKIDVDGSIDILSNVFKDEVFIDIEAKTNKVKLYCEDITMRGLLSRLKRDNNESLSKYIDFLFLPGGAKAMKTRHVVNSFERGETDIYYLLDGDEGKIPMLDPDTVPPSENTSLKDKIKLCLGSDITLEFNSNTSDQDKYMKYREFMKYYNDHVLYFPYENPEDMIVQEILSKDSKYTSSISSGNTKTKIYKSALIYYNLDKINNTEVEAFITYQLGQFKELGESLKDVVIFLEKAISNKVT